VKLANSAVNSSKSTLVEFGIGHRPPDRSSPAHPSGHRVARLRRSIDLVTPCIDLSFESLLAHLGDGGRPNWRPLIGVVLPPLWHQGHRGTLCPGSPAGAIRTAQRAPGSGGRTDWHQRRVPGVPYGLPGAILGVVNAWAASTGATGTVREVGLAAAAATRNSHRAARLPAFRSQPIQGCPIHTKGAGNIHNSLTCVQPLDRLAALMKG
jgi:hypothetical protein